MLDTLIDFIIRFKRAIIVVSVILAIAGGIAFFLVKVNYNMVDYLPPDAQSTVALEIMEDEFDTAMPNASVMVRDVSVQEALEYKARISAAEGVSDVMWLDDAVDIYEPMETLDADTVETYYKNNTALFSVVIEDGREPEACAAIWDIIGESNALSGEAPDVVAMQNATGTEVLNAILILVPIIILILIITTASWIEPLLFLATIAVAILINMGTNLFSGEVSFVTNSVSPILQLAVSLDYAVFMLHSFAANRKKTPDVNEAMRNAIKESMTTIAASASTTFFGFLALTFMSFQIGADLGFSLLKGIVFSFVATIVFLPALTLYLYKVIDKTTHHMLVPSTKNIYRFFSKLTIPAAIAVIVIMVPSFLGQGQTQFVYGNAMDGDATSASRSRSVINEEFGQSTIMAILVPIGEPAKELALSQDLTALEQTRSVVSYANTVGTGIPSGFLDDSVTQQFYSEHYARIIAYLNTPDEGEQAFEAVSQINAIVSKYYDDFYTLGQSANLYDMKNIVAVDNQLVTLLAIVSIFTVLLIAFRSAILPLILLLTIEVGIWINLAIPYFMGIEINFLGYLIANTVQLGATVDYAILLTSTYLRHRKVLPQKQAMHKAMGSSFLSILVSAATLATAGFTLAFTSSNPAVPDIGMLLGRGTLLSVFMVLCFLPALLRLFDRAIAKTTYKAQFFFEDTAKTSTSNT